MVKRPPDRPPPKPPPAGAIVTVTLPARRWYRVHRFDAATNQYAPDAFNDSADGDARFSPLLSSDASEQQRVTPTLYAAASERAAIAEVVLRNVPSPSAGYLHDLRRDLDSNLHVSALQAPALSLANLTTTGMNAAGLGPYALVAGGPKHYPVTRQWARWIWQTQPKAQGLMWMSRRYNRDEVIMLFGDRCPPGTLTCLSSQHISEHSHTIVAVLAEMGAGIIPDIY